MFFDIEHAVFFIYCSMSTQNKFLSFPITEAFSLPEDVVQGKPMISLYGNNKMDIDNHEGIMCYEKFKIVIKTKLYPICICGKDLFVVFYNRDTIRITGQIDEICFHL